DLAALRSFSKAAEANGLSQPTVTRLVRQLEERLGGALIGRSQRAPQLTAPGPGYFPRARRPPRPLLQPGAARAAGSAAAGAAARGVRRAGAHGARRGDLFRRPLGHGAVRRALHRAVPARPRPPRLRASEAGLRARPRRLGRARPRVVPGPHARAGSAAVAR